MSGNRRLRGKQASSREVVRPSQLRRLFHFEELSHLMASWLDQRSLCRLSAVDAERRSLAADPDVWSDRTLELKSRAIRNSSQLANLLKAAAGRWARVTSLSLPQCNVSVAAARALRAALPAIRSVDLQLCARAGSLRLLDELDDTDLEEVMTQGHLPRAPLRRLKTLKLCGKWSSVELHEGLDEWRNLPKVVPNLEVLHVPWVEEDDKNPLSQDMWEKLHEPPLGCRTDDECLRVLEKLNRLKEVDLSNVYTLTDAGLRTLSALPKLERLLLPNMGPHVTAEGLRHLADGVAPLRFLDLRRCMDTGCRPSAGRTTLLQADIEAFRRRRPTTEVLFS